MDILIGVEQGVKEIWAHKFRSFLTMLGVILGVGSLIAMFALTAGLAKGARSFMTEMGGVEKVGINDNQPPPWQEQIAELSPGRTYADVVALRHGAPLLEYVSPSMDLNGAKITHLNQQSNPKLVGAEQPYLDVENHEIAAGRFITDLDLEKSNKVIVIGRTVVEDLFPDDPGGNPLGEMVRINGENFRIVGVFKRYESEGDAKRRASGAMEREAAAARERSVAPNRRKRQANWDAFSQKNRAAVIPLSTMRTIFKSARINGDKDDGPDIKLNGLNVKVADFTQFRSSVEQVKNVLTISHRGIQDFGFDTREEWFDRIESQVRSMQLSGGLIAGISLLVGGLGITNIMLASITERIREIGIRRAVGARAIDIFIQIVIESVALAIIGGIIGLVVGGALVQLLEYVAPQDNAPIVEPISIIISMAFAIGVGILAGIYPAFRAAALSPLQALRYE